VAYCRDPLFAAITFMRAFTPPLLPAIALRTASGLMLALPALAGTESPPTTSLTASAPSSDAGRPLRIAEASGCLNCHQIDPRAPGADPDGEAASDYVQPPAPRPPIAPAWRDVATKYRHDPNALDRLTRTVVGGSNPYDSHWKYQISGLAMPPNRIAITQEDARLVVRWILSLDDAP
jgi:cytochrome c